MAALAGLVATLLNRHQVPRTIPSSSDTGVECAQGLEEMLDGEIAMKALRPLDQRHDEVTKDR
jgi:hypothetical protein